MTGPGVTCALAAPAAARKSPVTAATAATVRECLIGVPFVCVGCAWTNLGAPAWPGAPQGSSRAAREGLERSPESGEAFVPECFNGPRRSLN